MPFTIILFDTKRGRGQLYPLSLTNAIAQTRHGLFTVQEWYRNFFESEVYLLTTPYLQEMLPDSDCWLCIDATVLPNKNLAIQMRELLSGHMLEDDHGIIAYVCNTKPVFDSFPLFFEQATRCETVQRIKHPMDFVKTNNQKIEADIAVLNKDQLLAPDLNTNKIFGDHKVYIELGAKVQGCTFNTEEGSVFIGKNALLMEGSYFRGPVSIGEGAVVKMGAQIYGGTTIGKFCTAGGEIKNSILGDFSNKAHHGYLGDSFIGKWCNLGAGTSNSNVKNSAGMVNIWHEELKDFVPIGYKAGVIMGDFCKTAINTCINTGTTIGVCCSLHHTGFTEKYIKSFSWGPGEIYHLQGVIKDTEQWFKFKNRQPDPKLYKVLEYLHHSYHGS
jgi:UDP-N-acetylglucosamine diphosphorylase/glucosamine-1-phosphate N-acetyltransferase